ncbi:hypothetical protein ABZ135_21250 [Streptomyces sp. NPDC006339]|uniref:hypothetical protein n=1 Tax=Streptomyces sp. NPDC006339 TaxID=3156755 RepID=UPI0033B7649B
MSCRSRTSDAAARTLGAPGPRVAPRSQARHAVTVVRPPAVAVDTPPLSWVPSRSPVAHAARRRRGEAHRGGPSTAVAVPAARMALGLPGRYLARTGYDARRTDGPAAPRPHRLPGPYTALSRHPAAAGAAVEAAVEATALPARAVRRPRAERR